MTRTTSARVAGAAYLLYIAFAFPAMSIAARIMTGKTTAEKLASLAQNVGLAHAEIVLSLLAGLCALALAISLYAFTREEDSDIARLGMLCRFGEGLFAFPFISLSLLWLTGDGATVTGSSGLALAAWLMKLSGWMVTYSAYLFALGSTAFCYLLLRGRMIPAWLAWLGVVGSAILVVALPLSFIGALHKPVTDLVWIPIAIFEIVVSIWFLVTGGVRKAA
jgi:hypothetical protein